MKSLIRTSLALVATVLQPLAMAPVAAAPEAGLRAGIARVDITPAVADLPQPFTSIGEHIFVRTVVLESGGNRAVLVVADLPTIVADIFGPLRERIAAAAGVPARNVLLAVTHTHSAVRLDNQEKSILLPGSAKITAYTSDRIVQSVREAAAKLQPARAGFAFGTFRLGTARMEDASGSDTGGPGTREEPADRRLAVFKIEDTNGNPLAILVNNGPEPVMSMGSPRIGPDVAGAMERYVEQRFGDKPVVLYTVGSPPAVALDARHKIPGASPADPNVLISAVGTVLGEEVLATSARIETSPGLKIAGLVQELVCPGKVTTPLNAPHSCSDEPGSKLPACKFTTRDTGPIKLTMGVLQLGKLAIVQSDADVLPVVWSEVRNASPAPADTILIALTYGPVKYIVPDGMYPSNSYPATATLARPGCAEKGFVDGSLKMLRQSHAGG